MHFIINNDIVRPIKMNYERMKDYMVLFKTYSEKEVKRIKPIVDKINGLEEEISKLSDSELRAKTEEFKNRYKNGESLDSLLA